MIDAAFFGAVFRKDKFEKKIMKNLENIAVRRVNKSKNANAICSDDK